MNDHLTIRPAALHDIPLIHEAAARDKHGVAAPTHVVIKNDEIVGYLSMCVVPTVLLWLDSKKCAASNTVAVQHYIDEYMQQHKQLGYLVPIPDDSPARPFMSRLGFKLASPNTSIFFKSLSNELVSTPQQEGK